MSTVQINAYVAAMFEIASANEAVSVVEDDMFRLARAIESNEQLRAALNDTSLPADRPHPRQSGRHLGCPSQVAGLGCPSHS